MIADRSYTRWGSLFTGLCIALLSLLYFSNNVVQKPDQLAFGTETASVLGQVDGRVAHCMDATDAANCDRDYQSSPVKSTILWLGNSQLPGINRRQPGDENAPQILHRVLKKRNKYLITFSQPNANLDEHALVYVAVSDTYQPDLLMLPVVFDDIREFGIREWVGRFANDPSTYQRLTRTPFFSDLEPVLPRTSSDEDATENSTRVEQVEDWLSEKLASIWPLWESRANIRGTFSSAIHLLRNRVLGIHSYTKRSVNETLYRSRMALLEKLIVHVQSRKTQVLLYVPPYRSDIDGPYIAAEYARLKTDMQNLAKKTGAEYLNIEQVVPGPEWGTVTDYIYGFQEPDFMHFTAAGHVRFANALDQKLRAMGF